MKQNEGGKMDRWTELRNNLKRLYDQQEGAARSIDQVCEELRQAKNEYYRITDEINQTLEEINFLEQLSE
jgi:archaellum component FlaC